VKCDVHWNGRVGYVLQREEGRVLGVNVLQRRSLRVAH